MCLVKVTNVNRNSLKLHLRKLVEANLVAQHGTGRGTWYSLP